MVVSSSEPSPFLEQIEQSFYTNLVLLGFKADPVYRELGYRISPSMFRTPNVKGMEGVLYFLLTKVRPELKQEWRAMWPIIDKKQAREFKENVHKVLLELEKQGCFPTTTVRFFNLHSCGGEKFYHMVWNLSTHVLCSCLSGAEPCSRLEGGLFSQNVNVAQLDAQKRALSLGIYLTSVECLEVARRISESEKVWGSTARKLEEDYRRVQLKLSLIGSKRRELEKLLASEKSEQVEGNFGLEWDSLLNFFESTKTERGMIKDILNRNSGTTVIQGGQFCEGDWKDRSEPESLNANEVDLNDVLSRWVESVQPLLAKLNYVYDLSSRPEFRWLKKRVGSTTTKIEQSNGSSDQNALDQLLVSLDGLLVQHGHHLNHTRTLIEQLECELASDDAIISQLESELVVPPAPRVHERSTSSVSRECSAPAKTCTSPLNCDTLILNYSNSIKAGINSYPITPLLDMKTDHHQFFDWAGLSPSGLPTPQLDLCLSPNGYNSCYARV